MRIAFLTVPTRRGFDNIIVTTTTLCDGIDRAEHARYARVAIHFLQDEYEDYLIIYM